MRTPSPPRFQPAASSSALALSTLNSGTMALLLNCTGLLSRLGAGVARRPNTKSWMLLRSTSSPKALRTAGSENAKCFDLTLARSPSTSVVGSAALSMISSGLPVGLNTMRPLPPVSMALSTVSSTSTPQA
jgi:hypothetical protein